jgi:hypothetical protein
MVTLLLSTTDLNKQINLTFAPDEMIVRQVAYYDTGTGIGPPIGTFLLGTNLVSIGDGLLSSFTSPSTQLSLESTFTVNPQNLSCANFKVYFPNSLVLTKVPNGVLDGTLTVVLEFIKYDK